MSVKYDHDPENDYSDGYNAGRRYWTKRLKWRISAVFMVGAAIGAIVTFVALIVGMQ